LIAIGDFNHDNQVDNADIQGLLNLLIHNPAGGPVDSAVPEPATLALLAIAAATCGAGRYWNKQSKADLLSRNSVS
jgi:PEP-CTERM motif-containing protein